MALCNTTVVYVVIDCTHYSSVLSYMVQYHAKITHYSITIVVLQYSIKYLYDQCMYTCDIWPFIGIVNVWLPIEWCGIDGVYK